MKCDRKTMLLYAVTDRAWCGEKSLYEQVEAAIRGGATCVQLREKDLPEAEFLAEAKSISALCRRYGVPFIVNDNVDIAIACGADGVHVGQDDTEVSKVRERVGGAMIIGVTAHSVEEALEAERNGADYLGVGSMFTTSTKSNVRRLTKETLKSICEAVRIPVTAIGGIGRNNMRELAGTGTAGFALVSAIFGAADIEQACRELRRIAAETVGE